MSRIKKAAISPNDKFKSFAHVHYFLTKDLENINLNPK